MSCSIPASTYQEKKKKGLSRFSERGKTRAFRLPTRLRDSIGLLQRDVSKVSGSSLDHQNLAIINYNRESGMIVVSNWPKWSE